MNAVCLGVEVPHCWGRTDMMQALQARGLTKVRKFALSVQNPECVSLKQGCNPLNCSRKGPGVEMDTPQYVFESIRLLTTSQRDKVTSSSMNPRHTSYCQEAERSVFTSKSASVYIVPGLGCKHGQCPTGGMGRPHT